MLKQTVILTVIQSEPGARIVRPQFRLFIREHVKITQRTFATGCEMSGKLGGRQSLVYGQLSQAVTKLLRPELVLD